MQPELPSPSQSTNIAVLLEGRLHPMTLVLGLIGSLRKLIIPAIPILLMGNKFRWGGIGLFGLMLIGTIVTLLMRYFSFSYRIQGRELVTRDEVIPADEIAGVLDLRRMTEIGVPQGKHAAVAGG